MEPSAESHTPEEPDVLSGNRLIGALLARHLVPADEQTEKIKLILGLDKDKLRRRMNGDTRWTLDEYVKLAKHFGESLETVAEAEDLQPAVMVVGTFRLVCRALIDKEPQEQPSGALVATRPSTTGPWLITPVTDLTDQLTHGVKRVELDLDEGQRKRVAVLDDDEELSRKNADYMQAHGLDATPFFDAESLAAAIKVRRFDAYVLDWLLEDRQTVRPMLEAIRSADAQCPIVILTGQMQDGTLDEAELTTVAAAFRVSYLEKPIRPSVIMSALQVGLDLPRPVSASAS